jgi:hypothetical protein
MRRPPKTRKTGYGTLRIRASCASSAAAPSRKMRDSIELIGASALLPPLVHAFDKDIITRALSEEGALERLR